MYSDSGGLGFLAVQSWVSQAGVLSCVSLVARVPLLSQGTSKGVGRSGDPRSPRNRFMMIPLMLAFGKEFSGECPGQGPSQRDEWKAHMAWWPWLTHDPQQEHPHAPRLSFSL